MPKIPIFEPETRVTTTSPNTLVDAASYGIEGRGQAALLRDESELWGTVARTGQHLTTVSTQLAKSMDHAAKITDLANMKFAATKALYEGRNEIVKSGDPSKFTGDFEKLGKDVLASTMQMSSRPDVQAEFKNHYTGVYFTQYHGIMQEARQKQIQNFAGNVEAKLTDYKDLIVNTNDPNEKQRLVNEFSNYVDSGTQAGFILPAKSEVIKKTFQKSINLDTLNNMLINSPESAQVALKEKGAFGLDEEHRLMAIHKADTAIRQRQGQEYDDIIKGIENKQLPTIDQIKRLSGPQQHTVNRLVKSYGDETDKNVKVDFYKKVIDLPVDDKTGILGEKLGNDILNSGGLSANDKISLYGSVKDKVNKSQSIDSKQDENLIKSLKDVMDENHYKMLLYSWYNDPKGAAGMPKGATVAEKNQYIRNFATPFWDDSNKAYMGKAAGKTKKSFFDQEGAGLNPALPEPAPAGKAKVIPEKSFTQDNFDKAINDPMVKNSPLLRQQIINDGKKMGLKVPQE